MEPRIKWLEMPVLRGIDPNVYFRMERYFHINRLMEEEKVEAIAVCFDEALAWFKWKEK